MKQNELTAFLETSLIGRSCVISRLDHGWTFGLTGGVALTVEAPWRIVSNGRIAFASNDDGQEFGRPSPMDGEDEARRLLSDKTITSAALDKETADLTLQFDPATRIDVFNNSRGYEGWQATCVTDDRHWSVTAMGGGEIMFVAESTA